MLVQIRKLLKKFGQEHLIHRIEDLSEKQQNDLLNQLLKIDPNLSTLQNELLLKKHPLFSCEMQPILHYPKSGNPEDRKLGEEMIRQGKVACLILAGGQGTRLGVNGPKGAVAVSPIKGKSLFQIFSERVRAASRWSNHNLPLCIMTSPLNHLQTVRFFEDHHFFGLSPMQVFFFEQGMLPFIDEHGKWLLEEPGKIAEGPDGNGDALRHFFEIGLWEKMQKRGVEYLNVVVVDNVLAEPFDPEMIGFCYRNNLDVLLKAVERKESDSSMGIIAQCRDKLKLIEYSELSTDARSFTLSNTGLFCVSLEFIRYLYQDLHAKLPLHLARKTAQVLNLSAKQPHLEKVPIYKCERFIFDLFDYARKSSVLVYPREKIYAPLKSASGDKSLETVKQALFAFYRSQYEEFTGYKPCVSELEIDPAFDFPTEEMKRKLLNLPLYEKVYLSPFVDL